MKKILQLDGGGVKGLIQSAYLLKREKYTGIPIHKEFDLIVGTSVGAILGSMYASGIMSAEEVHDLFKRLVGPVFTRRWLPGARYSRKPVVKAYGQHLGGINLSDLATDFMCTSVNVCTGRTHFFKSWETKDGELAVIDAVNRSYAAPRDFGSIVDTVGGNVWLDGGTGNANCPMGEAVVEAVRRQWMVKGERVHLLSIGTGYTNHTIPFRKARRYGKLRQILYYMDPVNGGLARNQATCSKVAQIYTIAENLPSLSLERHDTLIPDRIDKLDGKKFAPLYERIGFDMWFRDNTRYRL